MYALLRSLTYNLKSTYELTVKIKQTLNDKTKTREDLLPLFEQLTSKFNVLCGDSESLFSRIYPDTKEKLLFVQKYCPEYQRLKQLIAQRQKEKTA